MESPGTRKHRRPGGNLASDNEDDDDFAPLHEFPGRGRGHDAVGRHRHTQMPAFSQQSSSQQSSSQQPVSEAELRFAELLRPIKDLTQNWEVDLSNMLENYMQELGGDLADAAAELVSTKVNFTEAALILQGTTSVYSKKVEYLWQSVLQMLDLLASRRALLEEEGNDDDGDKDKPGRKGRKGMGFDADDFQLAKVDTCKNIYMRVDTTTEKTLRERRSMLGFITVTPRQLIEKEGKEASTNLTVSLYGRGGGKDLLGHKEDFRINTQFTLSTGMLSDALFTAAEDLLTQSVSLLEDEERSFRDTTLLRPTNPIVNNEFEFTSQPDEDPPSPMADIPDDHDYAQPYDDPPVDDPGGPDEDLVVPQPGPSSTTAPADKFDALLANSHIVEHDYASAFGTEDNEEGRRSRRNVLKERLEEPRAPLEDPWEPIKPHEIVGSPKPIRKGRTCRAPPEMVAEKKRDVNARSNRYKRRGTNDATAAEESKAEESVRKHVCVVVPIEEYLIHEVVTQKYHNLGTLHGVVPELQDRAYEESKRRKQMLADAKKEGKDFVEDKVDKKAKEVDQEAVPDNNADPPIEDPNDDWEDFGGAAAVDDLFENVYADALADVVPPAVVGADEAPPDTYEDLVTRRVAEYVQQSQLYLQSTDLAKRVSRWHDHLNPILDRAEQRGNFDIHKYGSDLLSFFPNGAAKTTINFNDCVKDKDREEVCRYFLSSLMLANTYNVELTTGDDVTSVPSQTPTLVQKKSSGKRASSTTAATSASNPVLLPMDCMQLTLLSRRRHHEEMLMPDEEREQSQIQQTPGEIRRKEPKGKRKAKSRPAEPVHAASAEQDQSLGE